MGGRPDCNVSARVYARCIGGATRPGWHPRNVDDCDWISSQKGSAQIMLTLHTFKRSAVLGLALSISVLAPLQALTEEASKDAPRRDDSQIRGDLLASLKSDRYSKVAVDVANGVVTLTGSVELYADKQQVSNKARHVKGTAAIKDQLQVAAPQVPDEVLQRQLLRKIQYDRVGYGTTAFNAISVEVRNGVAVLRGHAYGPVDKDSAVSLAAYMPGIRDVIDEIAVDPVSPMDDRIRIQVARSVYGSPSLNRYALDPVKPIRISVQNGRVTLYGAVDSQMDKDTAFLKANSVPGVFSVSNELEVTQQGALRE